MNKVEITNELLARIYGAYMGCDYQLEYDSVTTGERVVKHQDFSIFTLYMHNPANSPETSKLLLLLTPLSEITDEDAIEVAKMMFCEGVPDAVFETEKVEDATLVIVNEVMQLAIYHDGCHFAAREVETGAYMPTLYAFEATDYLRSKGYDTGFANIPSLISAGIAIKKTTNG